MSEPEVQKETIRSLCDVLAKDRDEQKKMVEAIFETLQLQIPPQQEEGGKRELEKTDVLSSLLLHLETEHHEARVICDWLEYLHGELKRI